MKSAKITTICLFTLASMTAGAGFQGPGSQDHLDTVKSIAAMNDETEVTLEGHLIRQTGRESYIFKDKTGEITVEIEKEEFDGQTITPQIRIRINGEVDKDGTESSSTVIDVDNIEVIR